MKMIMWFHTRLTLSPSLFVFGKNLIVGNPVISYLRHKTITNKVLSYGCYGNTNSEAKSLWPSASNLATTHCREEKRKVFKGAGLQEMISHLHHHRLQRWWQLLRMLERVPCNGHTLEQKQHDNSTHPTAWRITHMVHKTQQGHSWLDLWRYYWSYQGLDRPHE